MRVINKTRYDTRTLRSIFCAVHGDMARKLDTWQHLCVTIVYSRRRRRHRFNEETQKIEHYLDSGGPTNMNGNAAYSGYRMRLRVPRTQVNTLWLAKLFHHEILHNYGKRHSEYPTHLDRKFWATGAEGYRWIIAKHEIPELMDEPPEEPKVKAKPTKEEKQSEAVTRLIARRKAWVTKAKRAATALAKIDKSLRYYQGQGIEVPELAEAPVKTAAKRRRRKRRKK
jgi:hypothetical protein